jgi:hypothetical protein
MMADIKINPQGYLVLQNGDFVITTGQDAIRQHLEMRLRTWLAETPYDPSAGVPYLQVIFKPGTNLASVKFILEQIALGTPGITGASLNPVLNRETREMTITGTAEGLNEPFDFTIQFPGA